MPKTESDIILKALQALNLVDHSGPVDAGLSKTAKDVYRVFHSGLMADLRDMHRLSRKSWGYDSVPDDVWVNVAIMAARKIAAVIPVDQQKLSEIQVQADMAHSDLLKVVAKRKSSFDRFPDIPQNHRYYTGGET